MNSFTELPNGEKVVDYSTFGSEGYTVQDIDCHDPKNRRMKVIAIGCGVSSILSAYNIQKHCENVELVAYEKNADIGGTWFENQYPGVACDIPAHAYSFLFAPNPDWPKLLASGSDVWNYLNKVCDVFRLRQYMRFNHKVVGMYWQEEQGKWLVKIHRFAPASGEAVDFEDTCDMVLYHKGALNTPKWPDIPGLDKFKGRVIHTSQWPKEYQKELWQTETVAVLGTGPSSIQVVPAMQPDVKQMDVYARSPVWFVQLSEDLAQGLQYSEQQKEEFRRDPGKLIAHVKELDGKFSRVFPGFFAGSEMSRQIRKQFEQRMAEHIRDERLLKGFTPNFSVGCRRISPGDPYMEAIQNSNVHVHFTGVKSVTESGVIGDDGVEREADTIICATGFDTTYRPPFPVVGRDGKVLSDIWAEEPNGYLGVAAPDMPNLTMVLGPAWPLINGSAASSFNANSMYEVQIIQKMQRENIKSWVPRQQAVDDFNQHVQEWIKHTIWKERCSSIYHNPKTRRVNAIWPGTAALFARMLESPRWEDMEISYHNQNRFGFMGLGFLPTDRNMESRADISPYWNVDAIDPKWWEAVGNGEPGVRMPSCRL